MPEKPVAAPAAVVAAPPVPFADGLDDHWRHSKIVREELDQLDSVDLPKLEAWPVEPLPAGLPEEARRLGQPVASLNRRERPAIWNTIAFTGWLVLAGASGVLALAILLFHEKAPNNRKIDRIQAIGIVCGVAPFILAGMGIASLIPGRTNSAHWNFWICEKGLIWENADDGHIGFSAWEDITELYEDLRSMLKPHPANPVCRVRLDGELIAFYPSRSPAVEFSRYILRKTSAAYFRAALRRIHDGEAVSFGALEVDGRSIHWQGRSYDWTALSGASILHNGAGRHFLRLEMRRPKESQSIKASHVSMVRVAVGLCRVMMTEARATDAESKALVF